MRNRCELWSLTALGLAMAGSWGCGNPGGPRPEMGKVHGTVTYKGNPLTTGTVTFVPIQGKGGESGQNAVGAIESDGSFDLTTFDTGDGAITGQHKAVVVSRSKGSSIDPSKGIIPSSVGPNAYVPPKALIPEKYMDAEKTPLVYTVRPGPNTFQIEIKD